MQSRTRNSLLGYGLSAQLIDLVGAAGPRRALLKAMSESRLTDAYGGTHAAVIADRLRRKPIDDAVVDAIIAEALAAAAFAQTGIPLARTKSTTLTSTRRRRTTQRRISSSFAPLTTRRSMIRAFPRRSKGNSDENHGTLLSESRKTIGLADCRFHTHSSLPSAMNRRHPSQISLSLYMHCQHIVSCLSRRARGRCLDERHDGRA